MPGDAGFAQLRPLFGDFPGVRSIIRIDVTRVSDSCGFGVPRYEYTGERDTLVRWADAKGEAGLAEYHRTRNAASIDGLPGYVAPEATQAKTPSAV
jgi:hypothetical protein